MGSALIRTRIVFRMLTLYLLGLLLRFALFRRRRLFNFVPQPYGYTLRFWFFKSVRVFAYLRVSEYVLPTFMVIWALLTTLSMGCCAFCRIQKFTIAKISRPCTGGQVGQKLVVLSIAQYLLEVWGHYLGTQCYLLTSTVKSF